MDKNTEAKKFKNDESQSLDLTNKNTLKKNFSSQFEFKKRSTSNSSRQSTKSSYSLREFHYSNYEETNHQQELKYQYNKSEFSLSRKSYQIVEPTCLKSHRNWQLTELGQKYKNIRLKNESKNVENNFFHFRLATYNLLAPDLLENNYYLYENIKRFYLDWENRKKRIFQQIKFLNCDIFCFQEMRFSDFQYYFKPKLNKQGYECFFKKRYGNEKTDGCCICFKTKKFELIKNVNVDYFVPGIEILNRENVGLILILKIKQSEKEKELKEKEEKYLCVATTHILFNPKRGDCKLAQLQVLLANLDRVAYKNFKIINNKLYPQYHPTILCGDFNCSNDSKLYEFIIKSKLKNYKFLNKHTLSGQQDSSKTNGSIQDTLLPERLGISDQCQFKQEVDKRLIETFVLDKNFNDIQTDCTFGSDNLSHFFKFNSVYDHFDENGLQEVTTCLPDCKKTVDYIFYHSGDDYLMDNENDNEEINVKEEESKKSSSQKRQRESLSHDDEVKKKLDLLSRLELFNVNHVNNICLPDKNYPSDHFILAGKFKLV